MTNWSSSALLHNQTETI